MLGCASPLNDGDTCCRRTQSLESQFAPDFRTFLQVFPKPMPRRFISSLSDGETIEEVFLLADKQLRANRNAALYLLVELRDKTGAINARMWNVTEDSVARV